MHRFTRGPYTFDVVDTDSLPVSFTPNGEVVILLHGFPQDSTSWANVAQLLHANGFRCLAPDLRGYSPGARPRARRHYRIEELVADVLALIDALGDAPGERAGGRRVHLVGHDWGAALAWVVARVAPERIATLTALSTPHPDTLAWAALRSRQLQRSWYMFFMQLPVVPELMIGAALRNGYMRRLGLPDRFAVAYERRLAEPDALRGGINWYRGMFLPPTRGGRGDGPSAVEVLRERPRRGSVGPVRVPTTYVWGRRDPYLGGTAARRTRKLVDADYRFVQLEAGHWLPECHAEEVAEAILARIETSR